MKAGKQKLIVQIAGLILLFTGLEWLAGRALAHSQWPYALVVLAYIAPALPLFIIFPLAIQHAKNSPDGALSAQRLAPVRRYLLRLGGGMFFYIVFLIGSVAALNRFELSTQVKVMLALLTALPIGGVIWAVAALMSDPQTDEFERMIMTRSVLASTGLTLFFSALWGFLENFADAPDFPLYLMVPVFFGLFGLVQPFVRRGFA